MRIRRRIHPSTRDRQAAALFAVLAISAIGGVIATGSLLLVAVAVLAAGAALASLRGYPIDREW